MPVQKTMVVTRPNWDIATSYGSYWIGKALILIKDKGMIVTELTDVSATKVNLISTLDSVDPIAFWGFGHGNETIFTGQDAEVLLEKGINEILMLGRVVHLTACLCGAIGGLCESLANAGAVAVVGYSVEFIIGLSTDNFPDDPANKATESLIKPDIEIEYALAEGTQIADALLRADNLSEAEIEYWRKSNHPDSDLVIFSHIQNMNGKVLYGVPYAQRRVQAPPISPVTVLGGYSFFFLILRAMIGR